MNPWRKKNECLLTIAPAPQLGALGRQALGNYEQDFQRTVWQSRPATAALGLYRLLYNRMTIDQLLRAMTDRPDTSTNTLGMFASISSWLLIQRLQASAFYLGDMPIMERVFGVIAPPLWAANTHQLDQLIALAICPDARQTRLWPMLEQQGLTADIVSGLRACERLRASLGLFYENVDRIASLWRNRTDLAALEQNARELWVATRPLRIALKHHNPLEAEKPMQQVWNKAEFMELALWRATSDDYFLQRMRSGQLYAFYARQAEETTWYIYSGGPLYGRPLQLQQMIWIHPDQQPMAAERAIWKANEITRALYLMNTSAAALQQEDIFWQDKSGFRINIEYENDHDY